MPRGARLSPGGLVYHVLNRGNERNPIFHKRGDAMAFINLLAEAKQRTPMRLLGWCLMNNHWHLVLWPYGDGELSAFMAWLSNAHVRRYRQHYHNNGNGHVYQGRFKSFAVKPDDSDLLRLLRYVEANPLRAGLVQRAEDWRWSSLHHWLHGGAPGLLDEWPIDRPTDWVEWVNQPQSECDLSRLRTSVTRNHPFGPDKWAQQTARSQGMQESPRPRGRPRSKAPTKGDTQNIPTSPPVESSPQTNDDRPTGTSR